MASAAGGSGEYFDVRSGVDGAGAGGAGQAEPVVSTAPIVAVDSRFDDEALAVALFRRRVLRTLAGCLLVVALTVVGVGGWLWWTRPLTREVSLPDGIAVEGGIYAQIDGGAIEPIETKDGKLRAARLRSEKHEWVGGVRWIRTDGSEEVVELRLGETAHIDGLGNVTLLAVNPRPLIPDDKTGGWIYKVYIVLDPGVEEIVR
ncbi:hypothetical protein [Actinomyces qiguomingii]|uniref:hypothetical protein n=1 Tax=Actinomyces qiguomingii TaxID=2057800 RepID=UPI000CA08EDD|nr:hypothetical protein [Actinomyces qiguomingii]